MFIILAALCMALFLSAVGWCRSFVEGVTARIGGGRNASAKVERSRPASATHVENAIGTQVGPLSVIG